MNQFHKPTSSTIKTRLRNFRLLISSSLCLAATLTAAADSAFYGTLEEHDDNHVVIRTTHHSVGHWTTDNATQRSGSFENGDWVYAFVETSGHVRVLRFEERPADRAGVIQKVENNVLTVHTGPNIERWNLKETTVLKDVAATDLQAGDAITAKLYKNHNLATLRVTKTGVPTK